MSHRHYLFANRAAAASRLRELLPLDQVKSENWHFIAISKGGLVLAAQMNERLRRPVDLLLSESIMAPHNATCEVARVSETEEIVMHENLVNSFEIQVDYIYGEAHRKHEERILANIYKYRKGRAFAEMEDQTVLLIDEGADTGMRLMTAIKTMMNMKAKAVHVAVPVLPTEVLENIEALVDRIYYLYDIEDYIETPAYYGELPAIDDKSIAKILGV